MQTSQAHFTTTVYAKFGGANRVHYQLQLQLQLYLKNSWQYRTKRTGPQIAFANLGGTVTLEDYNENKYTEFTKETYIIACTVGNWKRENFRNSKSMSSRFWYKWLIYFWSFSSPKVLRGTSCWNSRQLLKNTCHALINWSLTLETFASCFSSEQFLIYS